MRALVVGLLLLLPSVATGFEILSLDTTGSAVIDTNAVTGDDRGGIAVSGQHVFYTADGGTGRFALTDLSGGTNTGALYDAIASDLRSGKVYSLGNGISTLGFGGGLVTTLIEIGPGGFPTGTIVVLSSSISMLTGAIFSGDSRIVLHNGSSVFEIELPSGTVTDHGPVILPSGNFCESWARWGIAEDFGGDLYLTYVASPTAVDRLRVSDGAVSTLATFTNLGDTCSISFSLGLNRWYFRFEFNSEFGAVPEGLGYADATWAGTPLPDTDLDGVNDVADNCPADANPGQEDADSDFVGDACDPCPTDPTNDVDLDGICGLSDNCPDDPNPGQENADGDDVGDVCDVCPTDPINDDDLDGICGSVDNCPFIANFGQADADGDGLGNLCDSCTDTDEDGHGNPGFLNTTCATDNCPTIPNPSQLDRDGDLDGDACDDSDDVLNLTQAIIRHDSSGKSRGWIKLKGDFLLDTAPPVSEVFEGTGGIYMRVTDSVGLDVVTGPAFFREHHCKRSGSGVVKCKDVNKTAKATFKPVKGSPHLIRFTIKLRKLDIPPPVYGPIQLTLTYNGDVDRVDEILTCGATNRGLVCKGL